MSGLIQWESVCLVCLQKGESHCIFGEDNDSIVIADEIMKYSDILIKRDTNQPKRICLQCLDDLNVASKFHRNYEQSESIITALLNTNHQEFQIKDSWKTSLTTGNPILDICIKDEVVDNAAVDDSCEKRPCLDLNNADTEAKRIVEDHADSYVHSNANALNNVKSDPRNKTKQKKSKISRRPRGRPKKLSEVFRAKPKHIVDTSESKSCLDLKHHSDTEAEFVVEHGADFYVHSNTTELSKMKTGQNNKSEQKMNSKIPKGSRGQPKKLSEESSFTSGYKRSRRHPRVRPKHSTGISLKICEICNHGFRYQAALDIHMRRHNNERPFSCDHCDKAFVTRSQLQCHVRIHTGEKPYKCQYCDLRFADRNVRQNHESKHTGKKPYKCPTCEKSFGCAKGLMWHRRIHNGTSKNKFTCKECGKEYRRKKLFQKHVNRYINRDELNKSSEHTQKKSLEKEIFHIEENTNSNEINIKHEIVEDDLIDDNCDIGNTSCIDEIYDPVSEATNGEIPKQSTGVSLKICEICNHGFRYQSALDVHMRRHNNERPFSCENCDKAFVTRSALQCHVRIHTGEKPYKCQYCDLRFSTNSVKKSHESKHTGEKPFKCTACDKSYRYLTGLRKHLRIHNKFTCKEFRREKLFEKPVNPHLNRDELNKSSEHTQNKSLDKEIFQLQENTNSNEINIKLETSGAQPVST